MNYIAINELDHFNFHDAEIHKIDFYDNNMRWHVSSINATTLNSQNSFNEDMCIKEAEIVFEHFNIEKIIFGAYKVYDSSDNLIESVEAIIASPEEYDEILKNTLDNCCYIYSFEKLPALENGLNLVCFNIDGGAGSYYLTLSLSKSTVEWDEYSGKAWYEYKK